MPKICLSTEKAPVKVANDQQLASYQDCLYYLILLLILWYLSVLLHRLEMYCWCKVEKSCFLLLMPGLCLILRFLLLSLDYYVFSYQCYIWVQIFINMVMLPLLCCWHQTNIAKIILPHHLSNLFFCKLILIR